MKISNQKLKESFEKLLLEGQEIIQKSGWDGREYSRLPSGQDYSRWRTQAMNIVGRVCGKESDHYEALKDIANGDTTKLNSYYFKECYGILEAAYADFNDGLLFDIRHIIRADLLEDFLSQAEHLLENGFHIPAASLTGAVLEDTLRKLCDSHSIQYDTKTSINKLNDELARNDIYDGLVKKQVTAQAHVRNNADHGKFDGVKESDVEDMLRWVTRFVEERLE